MPPEADGRKHFRGGYRDADGAWHFAGHAEDLVAQAKLEMSGGLGRRAKDLTPPPPPQPAVPVRAPWRAPPPRPEPQPRAAGASEEPPAAAPATELGSAKIRSVTEGMAALGSLYEAFYAKWVSAGKLAPSASPLITEIEAETRALGARSEEIERLRNAVMQRTGYARLIGPEQQPPSPMEPEAAGVLVMLKSGERMRLRPEDIPAFKGLLVDLGERQRLHRASHGEHDNPRIAAMISQVRDILAQA